MFFIIIIVFELYTWSRDLNSSFTVKHCLFGGVKLTKNVDPDKYVYTEYDIRFDSRLEVSLPYGSVGKDVIIFGVDMSSSMSVVKKKKYILILGKAPVQGSDDTTLTAEAQY